MKKLKTLKDIFKELDREIESGDYWMSAFLNLNKNLKAEAIKWIKELEFRRRYQETPLKELYEKSLIESERWIMYFFNITEEDLKEKRA